MHVIVAGCGRVGSQLAEMLSFEGHDVVVIDKDRESFRRLGDTFNGLTLEGVAFDEELLLSAGIEKADAFASVTSFDNTNLMAAQVASVIYGVPNVISRLYYVEKELTFFKLGIDYVCSTTLMADRFREILFQGIDVVLQQDRLDLGLQVLEFVVPPEAQGKPAGNLEDPVNSWLIALLRGNRPVHWSTETTLEPGDRIVMTMRREGWNVVRDCLGDGSTESPACRLNVIPLTRETTNIMRGEPESARVVVGGCSAVGAHLAWTLSLEGHNVTVIDPDRKLFERLPGGHTCEFVEGTVYDDTTLVKAGIEEADAFTAVTKFDNTNLMAAEVARHIFGVPKVVARLFNPDKEPTYQALEMDFVCGTRMLAQSILERLMKPLVVVKASCFNNLYMLVEFQCPRPWVGRTVAQASSKANLRFAYVARRSTGHMPDDRFVLRDGDMITALTTPDRLHRLEAYLRRYRKG